MAREVRFLTQPRFLWISLKDRSSEEERGGEAHGSEEKVGAEVRASLFKALPLLLFPAVSQPHPRVHSPLPVTQQVALTPVVGGSMRSEVQRLPEKVHSLAVS